MVSFSRPCSEGVTHCAAHKSFNVCHRSDVMKLFASVYKRSESDGVQWRFGVIPTMSADPGVLQARGRARPFPWVLVKRGHDEVFGGLADPTEIVLWKAEVQPADVDAGLLQTFV